MWIKHGQGPVRNTGKAEGATRTPNLRLDVDGTLPIELLLQTERLVCRTTSCVSGSRDSTAGRVPGMMPGPWNEEANSLK